MKILEQFCNFLYYSYSTFNIRTKTKSFLVQIAASPLNSHVENKRNVAFMVLKNARRPVADPELK
jgi:hypothetical protein